MSVAQTAKRRRRQFANGHRHLALICGKSVKGGRPIYSAAKGGTVHDAIAREAARAERMAKAGMA